jgi:hypothetical protein
MPTKAAAAKKKTIKSKSTSASRPTAKTARKVGRPTAGKLLPRKIHVIIDGIPITLHAAKGKRTLTAVRLEAAMKKVIAARTQDK